MTEVNLAPRAIGQTQVQNFAKKKVSATAILNTGNVPGEKIAGTNMLRIGTVKQGVKDRLAQVRVKGIKVGETGVHLKAEASHPVKRPKPDANST